MCAERRRPIATRTRDRPKSPAKRVAFLSQHFGASFGRKMLEDAMDVGFLQAEKRESRGNRKFFGILGGKRAGADGNWPIETLTSVIARFRRPSAGWEPALANGGISRTSAQASYISWGWKAYSNASMARVGPGRNFCPCPDSNQIPSLIGVSEVFSCPNFLF
jgi:hypothetical protein